MSGWGPRKGGRWQWRGPARILGGVRGRRSCVHGVVIAVQVIAVVVIVAAACGGKRDEPKPKPKGLAALPKTKDGRPILASQEGDGFQLGLVYDETLDDPVTRWGGCFRTVLACHDPAEPSITACVRRIARCARAEGGDACCPAACLDQFDAALARGTGEDAAIDQVFLAGGCVPGFQGGTDAR